MILLGICAPIERISEAARLGFDYIECGLSGLAALSEDEFERLAEMALAAPIPVMALNVMLPASLKVTGPTVSYSEIEAYLARAFRRAARLGARTIVFGSGGARSVPEGFPMSEAVEQLATFLRLADGHAQRHGLTIAIEPLRRQESNVINLVSEAVLISSLLGLPHVKVLGDTYHMAMTGEPLASLTQAGALLRHVHLANPLGRVYPKAGDGEDYAQVFRALEAAGYEGGVSIEASCEDFEREAGEAVEVLRAARDGARG